MTFAETLKAKTKEIENMLAHYLPREEGLQKAVLSAMNYSVSAGGKRLRPMLLLETHSLFGGSSPAAKPLAAALEMIHTYSLVHDDLPCLDNDELRRGKPTTWKVFGEDMALLAGDALLNYAFEVALSALDEECNPNVIRAVQILAKKAGVSGMIGGQVVDVECEGKGADLDTVLFIHQNKTAALMEAAMTIGAILAGASEEDVLKAESLARDIGVSFQIKDDILDVTSTADILGKPVGSDARNEKVTYVTLKGLRQSQRDVEIMSERAINTLASLPGENTFLTELIRILVTRGK